MSEADDNLHPDTGHAPGISPGAEAGIPEQPETVEPDLLSKDAITKRPLLEMLMIAAPTVAAMTSHTLMQFIDGLMVSRIGPDPVYITAQGNAGMIAFMPIALAFGLTSVVNTFVSQHLGAGRPREGSAYAWNTLWLTLLTWAVVMLPCAWLAPEIFGLREWIIDAAGGGAAGGSAAEGGGSEGAGEPSQAVHPELMRYQVEYARIMLIGGFAVAGSRAIGHYFYGMHKPMLVLGATVAGNIVNVLANLVLVFGEAGMPADPAAQPVLAAITSAAASVAGWLGIPAMGVPGAALGTVIGAAVELAIPLAIFLSPAYAKKYGTRSSWRPDVAKLRDIFKIGWPAGLMFSNEIVCWGYLMVVLIGAAGGAAGEDPTAHNAVGWIALRYMHLSFMPVVGLSIALTAIVGKCKGMGRPDLAASRSWLGLRVALFYMGACAVAFYVFRAEMIGLFIPGDAEPSETATLVRIGSGVMIAAAVFQLFDAVAISLSGALRGAGDTVWPGVVTMALSWGCLVAGGHAIIWLMPQLGSLGPWIAAALYVITLGIALLLRFIAGKWKSITLVEPA